MKYINVAKANCKNCYKCLKVCPVKSIKYSDNHVEVLENECILCGRCIRNCPQKAKSFVNDISRLRDIMLDEGVKKVAALAPSYVAVFGGEQRFKLAGALRRLGFDAVEETAEGAREVSLEYARILEGGTMDNMITTCCPSTVFLVQKYFPELTKCLAPVLSPMETHGQMLRKKYGDGACIVFFSPCMSKSEEIRTSEPHYVDFNVTFKQMTEWMAEVGVEIGACEEGKIDSFTTKSARYPVFEGITDDVRAILPPDSKVEERYTFMSVQGTSELLELLQEIRAGRLHNCFIEASACYGSCINGPQNPTLEYTPLSRGISLKRYVKSIKETEFSGGGLKLERDIKPIELKLDMPDEKTIRAILTKIGKPTKEQELNCGSCGYRSCREKAIAVYQGKAQLYMCMPYMSQVSETFANVTLSVSPDYIVAVDSELNICECNLAAQKLFDLPRKDIVGRRIDEFLEPVEFAQAEVNKKSMPLTKVRYDRRGIIVNETIIYIPEQDISVAFMQDITRKEHETDSLNKVKEDTMQMAQKVIDKQMTVAQEIASLLGETTAETKATLTKLKDIVLYEGKEDNGNKNNVR